MRETVSLSRVRKTRVLYMVVTLLCWFAVTGVAEPQQGGGNIQAKGSAKPGGGGGGGGGTGSATFSGHATALRANVLGITTVISEAGPISASGGQAGTSLAEASVPGLLTVGVLHASTIGEGNATRSEASTANLVLTLTGVTVEAEFLMSRANALCSSVTATSEILGLKINGSATNVSGKPNQTINLGIGKVVINEQSTSMGSITVNALHVIVNGIADVVVSSAQAGITCSGTPSCGTGDFVTGGGWITGTPSGAKGNFGVGGGIKNGGLWGHLTFVDHGASGPKVKGTGVTAYVNEGGTLRRIEGTADIDGQAGTYRVYVADNGEPGRNDTFEIILSTGYRATGFLGGGNIQLHGAGACK